MAKVLTACVALLAISQVTNAADSSLGTYLVNNNKLFLQLLEAASVNTTVLGAAKGVILVPSNGAIQAFAAGMGMSPQQIARNPHLADQIVAYHFLPGVSVIKGLKLPSTPLVTKTGEVNYVVRFYKDSKTGTSWVQDTQGNNITLKKQPVRFDNLTVVPLDKVLMSGGYFYTVEDALKTHPSFQSAYKLLKKADSLGKGADGKPLASTDVLLFVPVDSAFKDGKVDVGSLSQEDARKLLQYHAVTQARHILDVKPGALQTLLPGQNVKLDVAHSGDLALPWSKGKKTIKNPSLTVTDAKGQAAKVKVYNVWAGKGVLQGIDRVLQPKGPATAAEAGSKPAAASSSQTAKAAPTNTQLKSPTAKQGSRRLLHLLLRELPLLQALHASHSIAGRKLMQDGDSTSHFNGQWGQNNPASSLTAMNTVGAAYAAQANYENAYYALPDSPGWAPMNQWSDWESNT